MTINRRSKMRRSQAKVKNLLLEEGYDFVFFNPHRRWDTITYFQNEQVRSKDIAGLFDGIALKDGKVYFLQVSTNYFHKHEPYAKFAKKYNIEGRILIYNVVDRKGIRKKVA